MIKRQFIFLSGLVVGELEEAALGHAWATKDGTRGHTSTGSISISITIGPGGYVSLAQPDEPSDTPAPVQTNSQLGAYLCTAGENTLTLCHNYVDDALVTVSGPYMDDTFIMHNSKHTVPLEIIAQTPSGDVPLKPHIATFLGTNCGEKCDKCGGRFGTQIIIRPLRACRPQEDDPYTGVVTFSVEAA
ncbi:MAG: hypothetical protein GC134_00440 [Proteobacteria bacterium]|nr:hypothetical protein [Pseudomonadota bacterium]